MLLELGGAPLPQRPMLTVLPAETCAACCVAQGEGLSAAVAGEAAHLVILARDAFGNPRDCGGDLFEVKLRQASRAEANGGSHGGGGAGGAIGGGSEVAGEVRACGDGTAAASFVPTSAGAGELRVTLGGEHTALSPSPSPSPSPSASASAWPAPAPYP